MVIYIVSFLAVSSDDLLEIVGSRVFCRIKGGGKDYGLGWGRDDALVRGNTVPERLFLACRCISRVACEMFGGIESDEDNNPALPPITCLGPTLVIALNCELGTGW
jgi:hypothetical protein